MYELHHTKSLPAHFRHQDFLDYHSRDSEGIAEYVIDQTIHKGILWHGSPAHLTIRLEEQQAYINLQRLDKPSDSASHDLHELEIMTDRLLGLAQPIEAFESEYCTHPVLGYLIQQHTGYRIPNASHPFDALVWAIIGQLISVKAATAIRRRLITAANLRGPDGIYCTPDAAHLVAMDTAELREAGLSKSKIATLQRCAQAAIDGDLAHMMENRSAWEHAAIQDISASLNSIKGIGAWTINYTLLRGCGYLDGSLHGDVAVQRNLQAVLALPDRPNERWTERWLAQFAPWRALVSAHLWAYQHSAGF